MMDVTFRVTSWSVLSPWVLRLSSEMKPEGARSDLLLNICRQVGPDSTFFGGLGGSRRYLDQGAFAGAGIGVKWQELQHPVYPQSHGGPFTPGV